MTSKQNLTKATNITKHATGTNLVKAAMKAPYLSQEEEHNLAVRWRTENDQEAMHRMTQAHMRLVISIAARFKNYGLPMGDLIQEGHVGLLEAAARFEPSREVRFSTYATWWIRASIQDYVLRNWSIVRGGTSSAQKSLFFNLRRLRAKLARDGKGTQQDMHSYIANAIGVSEKDVAKMDARLSGSDQSLNAPIVQSDGNSSDRQDFLVSEAPTPDQLVEYHIDTQRKSDWLKQAMETLTEREIKIIKMRRLQDKRVTLEELGTDLGISKERVRQIESRAMQKMKTVLMSTEKTASAFSLYKANP